MKKTKMILGIAALITLAGCNNQFIDTNWVFKEAVCRMPDGTSKEFDLKSWKNFEDGDMVQFTTTDGDVYLTHSMNCFLINK